MTVKDLKQILKTLQEQLDPQIQTIHVELYGDDLWLIIGTIMNRYEEREFFRYLLTDELDPVLIVDRFKRQEADHIDVW